MGDWIVLDPGEGTEVHVDLSTMPPEDVVGLRAAGRTIPGSPPRPVGIRPLLLGEAPSLNGDPADPGTPLGGRIAARLCALMGWAYTTRSWDADYNALAAYRCLTEHFETRNVIAQVQDADPWNRRLASDAWQLFLKRRLGSRDMPGVVVAFGRRAAAAIGAVDRPFYEWRDGQLYDSVVLPHPSGRNRLWNDPDTAVRVCQALNEALARSGVQR